MSAKMDCLLMASLESLHDRLSLLETEAQFGLGTRVVRATITADQVAQQLIQIVADYSHDMEPSDIANGRFPGRDLRNALDAHIRQHRAGIPKDSLKSALSTHVRSLSLGSYTERIIADAIDRVYGN